MYRRYDGSPGGICAECSFWWYELELDHRTPWFLNGAHEASNLQWLCIECHKKKTAYEMGVLSSIGWKGRRYRQPRPSKYQPSGVCTICGSFWYQLDIDHIRPLSQGGKHDTANIQWLCHSCHMEKTRQEKTGRKMPKSVADSIRQANQQFWREHPEMREATGLHSKEMWENPEYRILQEKLRKELGKRPDFREKCSQIMKSRWQQPEHRASFIQNIKDTWQKPDSRERLLTSRRDHPHHARPYPSLTGPDGTVYPVGFNLKQFCQDHGIAAYKDFHRIVAGTRRTYKGWRLTPL